RRPDEALEHGARLRPLQVDRQALLVSAVHRPVVIAIALRTAGHPVETAVRVALEGLDLDDLGAEVAHHRRGGPPRDEAPGVQNLDPAQHLVRSFLPAGAARGAAVTGRGGAAGTSGQNSAPPSSCRPAARSAGTARRSGPSPLAPPDRTPPRAAG